MKLRYSILAPIVFISTMLIAQEQSLEIDAKDIHYIVVLHVKDTQTAKTMYAGFPVNLFDSIATQDPQLVAYIHNQALECSALLGTPPDLSSFEQFAISQELRTENNDNFLVYTIALKNKAGKLYKMRFEPSIKLLKALLIPLIVDPQEKSTSQSAASSIDDMLEDMNTTESFDHHEGPAPLTGTKGFFAYLFSKCPSKLQEWILKVI